MTVACSDDSLVADSIEFYVSYTPAPTAAPSTAAPSTAAPSTAAPTAAPRRRRLDGGALDGGAFDDGAFDGGAVDVPADDVGTDSDPPSAGGIFYFWTASVVDVNASGNATAVLEAVVDAANLGDGKASLEMTSAQLESMAAGGASRVEIVLVLTNFLGGVSAPSAPFPVSVRTDQRRERFFS
ncbi:hypothetical protein JL720_15300 [Aureococcus anophagefferens]|nr:hypothetical protein JL720_15300 [Aureococcus anophagefferens]